MPYVNQYVPLWRLSRSRRWVDTNTYPYEPSTGLSPENFAMDSWQKCYFSSFEDISILFEDLWILIFRGSKDCPRMSVKYWWYEPETDHVEPRRREEIRVKTPNEANHQARKNTKPIKIGQHEWKYRHKPAVGSLLAHKNAQLRPKGLTIEAGPPKDQ